jgi:hypothetical protein
VLINLGKFDERSQVTSDSDQLKTPSVEDKYLVGASLHPPEGSELTTSPSQIRIHHLAHFQYPKSL